MDFASDPHLFDRLRTARQQVSHRKWLRAAEICVRMSADEWRRYGLRFLAWASRRSSPRPIALEINKLRSTMPGCAAIHATRLLPLDTANMRMAGLSISAVPVKLSDSLAAWLGTSVFDGEPTTTLSTSRSHDDA